MNGSEANVIDDTIWQVMTARALQKIMNTIGVVVAINDDDVCLLNASDEVLFGLYSPRQCLTASAFDHVGFVISFGSEV